MSARFPSHALTPAALEQASRAMVFNWLPAAQAHRDWLGPWADLLEPRERASMALLRRASQVLLDRHGLRQRYLRPSSDHAWLLEPEVSTRRVAQELGVAMLGGWVRHSLERTEVARQLQVLGPTNRARAMAHATTLHALPYPAGKAAAGALNAARWPIALSGPQAVFQLGVSCLAALLTDGSSGAHERFEMRFAQGLVVPLELNAAQRHEAQDLIQRLLQHRELVA